MTNSGFSWKMRTMTCRYLYRSQKCSPTRKAATPTAGLHKRARPIQTSVTAASSQDQVRVAGGEWRWARKAGYLFSPPATRDPPLLKPAYGQRAAPPAEAA